MIPYITIFGKKISLYIIMTLVGIFISGIFTTRIIKKEKKDVDEFLVVMLIAAVGLFFGGHILYGITNANYLFKAIVNFNKIASFKEFIDIFLFIFGGSVFYGGLIGMLITEYITVKKKKMDMKWCFDITAFSIPLFHMFARIGCFLSGCCYGVKSHIGFTYKHAIVELANGVRRFPIQLVESGYNLILFILLYTLYKKEKFKGKLIYIYLILYPIGRFIFEFFRGDEYRGFLFGLSTSQIVSIMLMLFAVISLICKRKKH